MFVVFCVSWKNSDSGNILKSPCTSAWLPQGRFMSNLVFGFLCQENPNVIKNGHKSGILYEDHSTLYFCRQNHIAIQAVSLNKMVSGR